MRQRPHFNPPTPPELRSTYAELKERFGDNFGIQPMDGVSTNAAGDPILSAQAHNDRIAAEWQREGKIPPTLGGVLVSRSLAALIEKQTGIPATNGGSPKEDTHDAA